MFSSTEPFGSSVTGAQRGLGARDLQLDCGLGRPVGCSSTLGCDCSCSSWAPWASSLHVMWVSRHHIPTNSVALFSADKYTHMNESGPRSHVHYLGSSENKA